MNANPCPVREVQRLTKEEIDRRIRMVLERVSAPGPADRGDGKVVEAFRPRRISTAELVRRMEPFLGRN